MWQNLNAFKLYLLVAQQSQTLCKVLKTSYVKQNINFNTKNQILQNS